VDVPETD
jgi:hypothetical protein